ncbi:flavoprotein, HI0933 family protein [Nitzschia inconspicua]|uniref:Flavoprotein, HI0933 family protein n=1 Tax=Nitzschia inconspicua TaxID=303405 RepID=A0A9K3L1N3_9STRA|nr:flavoprotein, HI0933 family protein [Nitzschia inconspicua]
MTIITFSTARKRPWKLAGVFLSISLSTHNQPNFWRSFSATALSASIRNGTCRRIGVIGGGASGIFAAISAAESAAIAESSGKGQSSKIEVVVLEATSNTLQKVKISGGGRCNVLHDTSKSVPTILSGYPRGQRELNGLYNKRFTPTMAQEWFEHRGVELKVEKDGRMFPVTDSSQTIINALMKSAEQAGVEIRLKQKVVHVEKAETSGFKVYFKDETNEFFDRIILATGSSPVGYTLAKSLGHDPLVTPIPSLFTLNCKHAVSPGGILHGLSGVSVPSATLTLKVPVEPQDSGNSNSPQNETNANPTSKRKRKASNKILEQNGPLLITHHGISGPATLRLSAFGAREFRNMNYRGSLTINWDVPSLGENIEELFEDLWSCTTTIPKRNVASVCPIPGNSIPRRLWSALVLASGFESNTEWKDAPKKSVRQLASNLVAFPLEFTGKGTFKDEFVTAGGVSLKEIDMKTMESNKCPGLHLCGEVINVDGITGGYNFMNCWSTGYVAGEACGCFESKKPDESLTNG